jgi:hypothetical protein
MFGGVIASIGDFGLAAALGAAAAGEAIMARPATASEKADKRMM